MDQSLSEAYDLVLTQNGLFNYETTPSLLGLQDPKFVIANTSLIDNVQTSGLLARYNVLLNIIEELKRDIKPTYGGSKSSVERLKRNINLARIEIRNCMQELDRCDQ